MPIRERGLDRLESAGSASSRAVAPARRAPRRERRERAHRPSGGRTSDCAAFRACALAPHRSAEPARGVERVVGEDEVRPRAPDRREQLDHGAPSRRSSPRSAAALIIAYSPLTLYAPSGSVVASRTRAMHVEVRQRGLDHQHVGPLVLVERRLAQRLAGVRRVHLVARPGRRTWARSRPPRGTARRSRDAYFTA